MVAKLCIQLQMGEAVSNLAFAMLCETKLIIYVPTYPVPEELKMILS
jgi:hypothetical protein